MKKLATVAATLAAAATFTLAPVVASSLASTAPAPVRAAASAVSLPAAEASYPYQCTWRWGVVYRYRVFGLVYEKWGWVRYCYQIPN